LFQVNGLPSIQLSHDLGVPPDPTNTYTIIKYGLLKDMLNILLNNQSVAVTVTTVLDQLQVGVGPGPLCSPSHKTCLSYKDLLKVISFVREYKNRGGFHMIFPSKNETQYISIVKHTHKLAKTKVTMVKRIYTNLRLHSLLTSILKLIESK